MAFVIAKILYLRNYAEAVLLLGAYKLTSAKELLSSSGEESITCSFLYEYPCDTDLQEDCLYHFMCGNHRLLSPKDCLRDEKLENEGNNSQYSNQALALKNAESPNSLLNYVKMSSLFY